MEAIGVIVVCAGLIALIWGVFQKVKAGRIVDAPLARTGDVAARGPQAGNAKGAVSAQGNVLCQQPLISPVTGTPCLYYRLEVDASWTEGPQKTQKSKSIEDTKRAANFAIDDGSGPIMIDASKGGDFEPMVTNRQEQKTGLLGGIVGEELVFGNYRLKPGILNIGTRYTVKEHVMPMTPSLFVCGRAVSGAIEAPGWRNLIMSNKTRDQLLAHATKSAKTFLIGGAASSAVGVVLGIVGVLMRPAPAPAAELTAANVTNPAPAAVDASAPSAPVATAQSATVAATHATPAPAKPAAHAAGTATAKASAGSKPAAPAAPAKK